MAIKGILFDKDGTLIDVDRTWLPIYSGILQDLFATDEAGAEFLLEKAGYDPATKRMRAGSVIAGGTTAQLVDIWWVGLSIKDRADMCRRLDHDYVALVEQHLTPLMPLPPIMAALKADGYRLGLATNDSFVSATRHVGLIGLTLHLEAIITSDRVSQAKPSGDMIRAFAAQTGLQPFEIAIVGDNTHDLEEAHNGGAGLGIGVLTGNATREDISHLADYVIDSVADLPRLLRSL